eukprot:3077243-Rhodomonas_salina.1
MQAAGDPGLILELHRQMQVSTDPQPCFSPPSPRRLDMFSSLCFPLRCSLRPRTLPADALSHRHRPSSAWPPSVLERWRLSVFFFLFPFLFCPPPQALPARARHSHTQTHTSPSSPWPPSLLYR